MDAVIVATPNYLHKEPVLEAARNHKNVFCEKPIALSYADCDEMVNTCKENNVVFMAGHVMNFFHGVRLAKKFIQEGRIGKVLYAHSAVTAGRSRSPLSAGRSSAPSPAAICITTSMSWTASSSSWDPQPVLP